MSHNRIAIVIPVFDDWPSLKTLVEELAGVLRDRNVRLLIVDDGSVTPAGSSALSLPLPGEIVSLKRNVGHQRAIAAGIAQAVDANDGDLIVVMDADGEDRPSDVSRLVAALESGDAAAIAVGERRKRSEGFAFSVLYLLYRLVFSILTGQSIRFGNFCAMRISAARRLADMSKSWLSLPGAMLRSRLPIVRVPTERGHRYHGVSHMGLVSLVIHAFGNMAVFIDRVLTRMILGAFLLLGICILASGIALFLKLAGMATPGWLTTVLGTSLVLLVSTGVLCFIGLFVGITGGAQLAPPPSAAYRIMIREIVKFDGASNVKRSPGRVAAAE